MVIGFFFGGVFTYFGIVSYRMGIVHEVFAWSALAISALGLGIANLLILWAE